MFVKILFFLLLPLSLFSNALVAESIKDAIVKIYTVSKIYDYKEPWNSRTIRTSGSGCIIAGNRILTNAHVVENSTFIEVKRYGTTRRLPSVVKYVSHQADLAIIEVEDNSFFEGVTPLSFDSLPTIQQKVTVCGFPAGGNTLSVTSGIVSRIEHRRYVHAGESFLAIQVDAAINSGNSGGPAISDDKIVGVVMQGMLKSNSIGYIVPVFMIKHFLEDIKDGRYDGFGHLGIDTENVENRALREMYGLDENTTGVLVINVIYNSAAKDVLKIGDIITHIDGHQINNDATVEFRYHQFTSYKYFVDLHQLGDSIDLRIIRDQKPLQVKVLLNKIVDDFLLVKTTRFDIPPRYFIYGGYVFVPLTKNLLNSSRQRSIKLSFLASQWPSEEKKESVVLLKVLASSLTQGNYSLGMLPIEKINGETFSTFDEFYKRMQAFDGKYLLLEDDENFEIVIDVNASKQKNSEILQRYNLKFNKSNDLR